MITGKGSNTDASGGATRAAASDVRFSSGYMVIALSDGRQLSIPLKFYPTLLRATPAQRSAWQLTGRGTGICWDDLDLQLSVQYLLEGAREGVPKPPDFPELGLVADAKSSRRSGKKRSA